MRIQPRTKGRRNVSSGVTKEINRRIEQTASRFNCSKSFVVNTMLGEALGLDLDEVYYRPKEFSTILRNDNSQIRRSKVISINRERA